MAHDAAFDEDVLEAATKVYECEYNYGRSDWRTSDAVVDLLKTIRDRGRAIDADNERAEAEAEAARRLEHQIGSAEKDRKRRAG